MNFNDGISKIISLSNVFEYQLVEINETETQQRCFEILTSCQRRRVLRGRTSVVEPVNFILAVVFLSVSKAPAILPQKSAVVHGVEMSTIVDSYLPSRGFLRDYLLVSEAIKMFYSYYNYMLIQKEKRMYSDQLRPPMQSLLKLIDLY